MSVIIKGVKMPKGCRDCFAFYDGYCKASEIIDGDGLPCHNEVSYETYRTKREAFCPLIPIPPHGRLIDADALLERFEKEEKAADEHGRDFSFSFKSGGENCTEWWPVQQMLMDAPTIIPEERRVTHEHNSKGR